LIGVSFSEWARSLVIKTDLGLQPFELFDWQAKTADLICGEQALTRRPISLLSSRQTGKTSLLLAVSTYLALSRPQFTAVIVHRTTDDAHLLCRRVKRFLTGIPMKTDSLGLLEFADTDSALHFRSSNPNKSDGAEQVGRGIESVDLAIFEEASHMSNLKDCVGVLAPALTWSAMGLMFFVGTAASKVSYYYQSLTTAAGGEQPLEGLLEGIRESKKEPFQVMDRGTGAVGILTNWRAIDRFKDEPNFLGRVQSEFELSDDQIDSEYELRFGSGGVAAVFDFSLVREATKGAYSVANQEKIYYMGLDPAGAGSDFTVCIILEKVDEDDFRVANLYRRKKGTSEQHLANVCDLLQDYDPIQCLVEKNSLGELYLENLVRAIPGMAIHGFFTSQQSKELIVGKVNLALERKALSFPAGPIASELLTFRRLGRKLRDLGAAAGCHDDTVIALGLALHAAQYGKILDSDEKLCSTAAAAIFERAAAQTGALRDGASVSLDVL